MRGRENEEGEGGIEVTWAEGVGVGGGLSSRYEYGEIDDNDNGNFYFTSS